MRNTVFFKKKDRLGELLVRNSKIQQDEMKSARAHMGTVPKGLGEILVSLGFVSENDLVEILVEQVALEVYDPESADEFLPIEISKLFHREHPFAILQRDKRNIMVVADPLDGDLLSAVELLFPGPFEVMISSSYCELSPLWRKADWEERTLLWLSGM